MALTERDMNISHKTPPTHRSLQAQSKLPRRVPAPNSTPNTPKWSSSVADRVASAEKTAASSPMLRSNKAKITATNKPLPGDKPLPSRPIVRVANTLSPSKDSRSLIDASEAPLHINSLTGDKRDWPTLQPQSATSSSINTLTISDYSSSEPDVETPASSQVPATPASVIAAAAMLSEVIAGTSSHTKQHDSTSSHSPASSYTSAHEQSPPARLSRRASLNVEKTRSSVVTPAHASTPSMHQSTDYPTRQSSLRTRISTGSLISCSANSTHKFVGFTDFTKARDPSPTSTESRQHSPSPASFSRPRPGSACNSPFATKAMKTPSRIPIPDSKKATVVDVKQHRSSGSPLPSSTLLPSFGSQRLGSPEALKVLENGKMRRELKRMETKASLRGAMLDTWTIGSNDSVSTAETPSLSHSFGTSPEGTVAPNSPEMGFVAAHSGATDEMTVDRDGPMGTNEPQDQKHTIKHVFADCRDDSKSEEYANGTYFNTRLPPQTSPFAAPLQTIPSEAVLPIEDHYEDEESDDELTHTLSQLEGKGSPLKTDVDQETLLHMFGHLKRGLDKNMESSAALAENAAAAEMYLAKNPSVTPGTKTCGQSGQQCIKGPLTSVADAKNSRAASMQAGKRKLTMISKWSDSTPSDKGLSPVGDGLSLVQTQASLKSQQSRAASRDPTAKSVSIGFPSRFSTTIYDSAEPHSPGEAAAPPCIRRPSSPILGLDSKPGSVRNAREGIQVATASFARTTASAQSKRTTRLPTPNTKILKLPETTPRGRKSHADKRESRAATGVDAKTPRSRSKSRFVLDKINGLFSGRREKRDSIVPPVPRIERCRINTAASANTTGFHSSPAGSPSSIVVKTSQLPNMPYMSHYSESPLRSPASTAALDGDTTTSEGSTNTQSVQILSEHLLSKAKQETDVKRRERLLNFAKVLNDALISAREAQISAETAQQAAKRAQLSYEMTQKSLAMLQRLAATMASSNRR